MINDLSNTSIFEPLAYSLNDSSYSLYKYIYFSNDVIKKAKESANGEEIRGKHGVKTSDLWWVTAEVLSGWEVGRRAEILVEHH